MPNEQTQTIGEREYTREEMREACLNNYNAGRQEFEVANYELTMRLDNAEWTLRRLGYDRCTSIACNCKGYHQRD